MQKLSWFSVLFVFMSLPIIKQYVTALKSLEIGASLMIGEDPWDIYEIALSHAPILQVKPTAKLDVGNFMLIAYDM